MSGFAVRRGLSGLRVLPAHARDALSQAQHTAVLLRAEAVEAGRAEGLASVAALQLEARATLARTAERDVAVIAEVALEAARSLVGTAVADNPEVVAHAVSEALAVFVRARRALVRVHPDDAAVAREVVAAWAAGQGAEAAEIFADPGVRRGGVVLETDRGRLDARIETRLGALQRALLGPGASS